MVSTFPKPHCIRLIIQQQFLTCFNFFLDFWAFKNLFFCLKQLSDAAPADTCSRCLIQFIYFFIGPKVKTLSFQMGHLQLLWVEHKQNYDTNKFKIFPIFPIFKNVFTVFYLLMDLAMQTSSLWSLTETLVFKIFLKFFFGRLLKLKEM